MLYLKNLQKFRKKAGLTQEKLAKKSGVPYNTIIKIERGGIGNPRIETAFKLARALEIKLDDFVRGRFKK
jgi:transcriptional regulator with XRE-family HTH domain